MCCAVTQMAAEREAGGGDSKASDSKDTSEGEARDATSEEEDKKRE